MGRGMDLQAFGQSFEEAKTSLGKFRIMILTKDMQELITSRYLQTFNMVN